MAKAFAERLETLGDWSHIDDNSPIRPLGEQAVAIWNELIALDVAKTMSDHYGNVPQHSLKVGRK